ncbi:hypothetical protein Tco_0773080 [Tanacetum coccineum]|uniref:Uncharacterized protein n=1 Tax=Tanacetum coccineum TaxID=301880 RepID=A0ABQ4ZJP5_9ASTR
MYSYSYSNLDKLIWLSETLKKGSPFAPNSESNEPPLRSHQFWKKTFYREDLREINQMHQTCKKSSLAMTHKLDDMIELSKSRPKKTYKENLECEVVMVKMPRCMSFLGSTNACDEPIGSLEEVEETIGILMEVEPLDETQLEDLGLNTCNHDIPLSFREVPSFDESKPQPQP